MASDEQIRSTVIAALEVIATRDKALADAQAEIARLRAALEPFGRFADALKQRPHKREIAAVQVGEAWIVLRVEDCREARAALSSTETGTAETRG